MQLHVVDEFSPLKKAAVCWGYSVPEFEAYEGDDPEELRWGWPKWDRELLLKQQDVFFSRLQKYGIELIELKTAVNLSQQMYTRDIAFVIGSTLYYSPHRTLKARNGEIDKLLDALALTPDQVMTLSGKMEGGDVVVGETTLIGISNRTNETAFAEISQLVKARKLTLGDGVMHLDTRLTLLPNNFALVCPEFFAEPDWAFIQHEYKVIPITRAEAKGLGCNVLVVNPETIFVELQQPRIQEELKKAGFKLEVIPYSEPIAMDGSFRCTTLPLVRE